MNIIAQFIDPDLLFELDDREIRALGAIIDSEISRNPDIRKAITMRLSEIVPKLRKGVAKK